MPRLHARRRVAVRRDLPVPGVVCVRSVGALAAGAAALPRVRRAAVGLRATPASLAAVVTLPPAVGTVAARHTLFFMYNTSSSHAVITQNF